MDFYTVAKDWIVDNQDKIYIYLPYGIFGLVIDVFSYASVFAATSG